jgi:hypothetical protein
MRKKIKLNRGTDEVLPAVWRLKPKEVSSASARSSSSMQVKNSNVSAYGGSKFKSKIKNC